MPTTTPHGPASVDLACPSCTGREFHIRAIANQGLATVQCTTCLRHYLFLDSADYWFDAIQAGYPSQTRCKCKSKTFNITCHYAYRDGGDVETVAADTLCHACAKTKDLLSMDILHSGTAYLYEKPLEPCEKPKILYDLKQISLYATYDDIARVVEFLAETFNCRFLVKTTHQVAHAVTHENKWTWRPMSARETAAQIRNNQPQSGKSNYLALFAYLPPIPQLDPASTLSDEALFYKRNNVISISSPFTIVSPGQGGGDLFYLKFSNDYLDGPKITPKDAAFTAMTAGLMNWLPTQFIPNRGKLCFDNPAEHKRIFGDQFSR